MSARKITGITWDQIEQTCELLTRTQIWDPEFGTSPLLQRAPGRLPGSKTSEQGKGRGEGDANQAKP